MPSKEGPAAAWKQAAAHGKMPIQMWAKWPDGVTLDEIVESRGRLEDWFTDLDKVVVPYLARRYDQLTALVQMQPLCEASSASWRETGCSALRGSFGAAETDVKTTLPALMATGLATMRGKGVDAALLDAAQAKLQAGDVKGAAIVYDAALRSTEGT